MMNFTKAERVSDRELVISRTFDAPAQHVFDAWTKPELLKRWWVPRSFGMKLLSWVADVRAGGSYRLEYDLGGGRTMAFFGHYTEVTPPKRLAWTNEESEDGALTSVTFEEKNGKTLLVFREVYPSKEALDRSCEGTEMGMREQFEQLEELLSSK